MVIPFIPNKNQIKYLKERHTKNIILKARQLGFSTLIEIVLLDKIIFNDNFSCGVISHNLGSSKDIFRNKVKFGLVNMPKWLLSWIQTDKDNSWELELDNGSDIAVSTTFRWGTLQHLHLSEFGKICNKRPEDAREIVTGALNTVSPNNNVDIESTAEGNSWPFYDMTMKSRANMESGKLLWPLDYKFHFFPWFNDETYSLDPKYAIVTDDTRNYFKSLSELLNLTFSEEQIAWYQVKSDEQGDDMMREYPSTPDEAFNMAIKGAYYEKHLSSARKQGRICKVAYDSMLDVNTCWDLGGASKTGDETAIWFYQLFGREVRLIDYWEGNGHSIVECINVVKKKGYKPWTNYWPWDLRITEYSTGKTRKQTANENGFYFIDVPKISIADWIDKAKNIFSRCYFDEERCSVWINSLWKYHKMYDKKRGMLIDKPDHWQESHGADAFRYLASSLTDINYENDNDEYVPPNLDPFA